MSLALGKKCLLQKNFKDAEKIFLDLSKNNNTFEINYNLGVINFELRNIKKSLQFFEKCKKIDPKSLNTYLKIAYLEQSIGDIEKSLSTYLKVLDINIRDIRAYYGIFSLNPNFLKTHHFQVIKQINDNPSVTTIGSSLNYSSSSITGFIDEFRLTHKARYTSNFTAPTKEFPNN